MKAELVEGKLLTMMKVKAFLTAMKNADWEKARKRLIIA